MGQNIFQATSVESSLPIPNLLYDNKCNRMTKLTCEHTLRKGEIGKASSAIRRGFTISDIAVQKAIAAPGIHKPDVIAPR